MKWKVGNGHFVWRNLKVKLTSKKTWKLNLNSERKRCWRKKPKDILKLNLLIYTKKGLLIEPSFVHNHPLCALFIHAQNNYEIFILTTKNDKIIGPLKG